MNATGGWQPLGVPFEIVLFALTLLGVALLHGRTLEVALTGLATVAAYKWLMVGFEAGPGVGGLIALTKLALEQGGYDRGMLAYAVGFGGEAR